MISPSQSEQIIKKAVSDILMIWRRGPGILHVDKMGATSSWGIKQEVLERTNLPTFLTLFKSKVSFGKSKFYYIFIFHSFTAKVK
jgi:hypothetical protein